MEQPIEAKSHVLVIGVSITRSSVAEDSNEDKSILQNHAYSGHENEPGIMAFLIYPEKAKPGT